MMAVVMAAGSSQSFRLFGARGALFTFNGSAGQANGLLRSAGLVHQQFYVMFSPSVCFNVGGGGWERGWLVGVGGEWWEYPACLPVFFFHRV